MPMKWQPQKPNTKPIFILPKKYQYLTKFKEDVTQDMKIPIKYQEIWDINTKYRVGIDVFLVYQIVGDRLTSLLFIIYCDNI